MENLVKKTMTAFLVLLTLMIPVSAATSLDNSDNRVINIDTDDSYVDVVFYYTNSNMTANETVELTFTSDALRYETTHELNALAGNERTSTSVRLLLADNLTVGNYSMTYVDNSTSGFTGDSGDYTLVVSTVTPDYYAANLVADNDYENEVSPGDTLVLELELENGNMVFNDVSLEAYLRDSNGLRVSEIQETSDFNLVAEEEETVTMQFEIEEDLEEGTYEIYVVGTSDEGTLFEETYSVSVEREENSLVVTDLRVSNGATAGETVDVAVTILNNGQTDEDNVLVSLSVAGETVTSDYFTVEEDEELVRYFTMTLPTGASGNEVVTVNVANEDVSVSASSTVNVDAVAQTTSLTEEQVAALLDARLNNNNDVNGMSLGWLVAGLLLVYLLVSSKGMMPTTSRATSTSSRGRKSSKKYY